MTYWWLDRTLPGVVASVIWACALWISHRRLWHHIIRVAEQQNTHIEQLTATQTAELTGRRMPARCADNTDQGADVPLFHHQPHPWREQRKQAGPVKVEDHRGAGRNARIGLVITTLVGTMWAGYIFSLIALISLPSAIKSGNLTVIIAWLSSNFLQLVLLPVIIVGQSIQARAADARAEQTYNDAEAVLHEAQQIQDHLAAQDDRLAAQDQVLAGLTAKLATSTNGGGTS